MATRLEELPVAGAVAAPPRAVPAASPAASPVPPAAPAPPPAGRPALVPHPLTGLRHHHAVVIDPGHGGADPGNQGRYFYGGLVEKDITHAVARLLRAELARRGIPATLTRTLATPIDT